MLYPLRGNASIPKAQTSITEREFDIDEYSDGNAPIETNWARRHSTFVCCPIETCTEHLHEWDAHNDAIVIAVDGACRNNGKPKAKVGTGICFHRDNWRWNSAVTLDDAYNTSQRAELYAGWLALSLAAKLRRNNPLGGKKLRVCNWPSRRLRRVVIKADSKYLVKGMTSWIYKWRANGYENCRGLSVTNADLFKRLDQAVEDLNGMNVEVQFWHVGRDSNRVCRLSRQCCSGWCWRRGRSGPIPRRAILRDTLQGIAHWRSCWRQSVMCTGMPHSGRR